MLKAKAFALAVTSAALLISASGHAAGNSAAGGPERVVSMNLCTDQLAMMIAAPGQLLSVSFLSHERGGSVMWEEAQDYPANHGLAEEIFLMEPDLVIAGTYTTRTTVSLLQRLGIPVVEFSPANNFADISDHITKMGETLGRSEKADEIRAQFERDLKVFDKDAGPGHRAALYYANSYTSGEGTLAHAVLKTAGLVNIAAELGFQGGSHMPLEILLMEAPALVVEGQQYDLPARANEVLEHPGLVQAKKAAAATSSVADAHWVCGTPHVLKAVRHLRRALPAQETQPAQ